MNKGSDKVVRKKLLSLGIIGIFLVMIMPSHITFATEINATIKGNMNDKIGEIRKEISYEGWHSSGGDSKWSGYWDFYRTQGDQGVGRKHQKPDGTRPKVTVQDFKMKNFFSGTWENLPGGVVDENYELPNQVKKFINVYGDNNLGIRFNVGNKKSIKNGDIYYKIKGDQINIRFKGILNYVRYNMWQVLNPRVVKQMNRPEVSVPQVLEGCGDNRLSLGQYGKRYMKLTPKIVKEAYHKNRNKWLNVGGEESLWATFSNGGNNGVKWYFPINIDFYDLNVYTNQIELNDKNIYKDDRGNWVKVGEEFTLKQSGYASNYDDVVKVNENGLNINGKDEAINSWIWKDENTSNKGNLNYNVELSLDNTECNRNKETLNSSYKLKALKEGDYNFSGYSKLINNIQEENSHKLYKKSTNSETLTIKADGTAPTGNCNFDFNEDTHVIKINVSNVTDNGGSGVKKVWVHYVNKNNPKDEKDIEINKDFNGNYVKTDNLTDLFNNASDFNIKIFAEDNVGNKRELANKDVDVLRLDASIYRVLAPHDPVFLTNETGIVKVNLFGGFDRLKIIFPKELTDLNKNLNLDTNLIPKLEDNYNYKFIIPEKAKDKDYTLHVIGYKGKEIRECYPTLSVNGKITGLLKTRIRRIGDINSK